MKIEENLKESEYLFHQGTNFYAYEYMGVTVKQKGDKFIYTFRTWAPNAYSVGLVSDFSGWGKGLEMNKISSGIWEIDFYSDCSLNGSAYKFLINGKNGTHLKGDPYARYSLGGADGASLIFTSEFTWEDEEWLRKRDSFENTPEQPYLSCPINIYELHLASFMRAENGDYLSYREMAEILPVYLRYMGYTHVEFLPISEYPYDPSWGYQVGAFYAPSSRFGNPDDFKYLINTLHKFGIGIILDWVPAHFPKDEWGLYEFDGEPLYEYQGIDRQESETWGTRFFDIGREEVQSFLISNALYYLREFHIDGLRVDAVASMLYLDYDKTDGKWIKNSVGGRENLEAIAFFKKLNERIFYEFPSVLMIAEESGDFGKITHPTSVGGLGFNLKWNMGWANDLYKYISTDPLFRKYHHSALTFPIMYAFSENYVLPFSHDEVVHGKLSLIDKMYGDYENKFLQLRLTFLFMMSFPGKKMTFMGCEFGQFKEWDYESSIEWFLLDYEKHHSLREYVASLNRFYLSEKAMWYSDFSSDGFEWLSVDEDEKNSIAYKRKSNTEELIAVFNFSGAKQCLKFKIDKKVLYKTLFSTNSIDESNVFKPKTDCDNVYLEIELEKFSGKIIKESTIILEGEEKCTVKKNV